MNNKNYIVDFLGRMISSEPFSGIVKSPPALKVRIGCDCICKTFAYVILACIAKKVFFIITFFLEYLFLLTKRGFLLLYRAKFTKLSDKDIISFAIAKFFNAFGLADSFAFISMRFKTSFAALIYSSLITTNLKFLFNK